MRRRVPLFFWSLVYTRPHQLFARLALTVRRHASVLLSRRREPRYLAPEGGLPEVASTPPGPVFAPRGHLVEEREGGPFLHLQCAHLPLTTPMAWTPSERLVTTLLGKVNLHFMEFLEALDDETFALVVEDWIQNNRPYGRGYWVGAWNSYAVSVRCVVWMQQLALRSDRLPAGFLRLMNRSLVFQLRFLANNLEVDLGGNHLIKNAKALLWAGRYFRAEEANRWAAIGARRLVHELHEQILFDGMHFERSPAYHAQVFGDVLECLSIARGAELEHAAEAMAQALIDTTHPDGLCSLMGDGGLHMAYSLDELLRVYRLLGGEPRPSAEFIRLQHAGYYGWRDGDDYTLIDCGAIAPDHLPAHGHGDILSFEWTVAGRRIIVDPGVYQYEAGGWRDWSRATSSHNTVTVDDADQGEFWSSFRLARRASIFPPSLQLLDDGFRLSGGHDGFSRLAGKPIHRRTFSVSSGSIEVIDAVEGGKGQPVCARLLLHPDVRCTVVGGSARLEHDGVCVQLKTQGTIEVARGYYCPDFGVKHETSQLVMEYGAAPCEGGFSLTVSSRPTEASPQSGAARSKGSPTEA